MSTKTATDYVVSVTTIGFGRYQGGDYGWVVHFTDEHKARDYYTDMLLRYPNYEVKFEKR